MHGLYYTLEGLCGLCLTQWCTLSHTALLELYMGNRLTFPQMSGVCGMSQQHPAVLQHQQHHFCRRNRPVPTTDMARGTHRQRQIWYGLDRCTVQVYSHSQILCISLPVYLSSLHVIPKAICIDPLLQKWVWPTIHITNGLGSCVL